MPARAPVSPGPHLSLPEEVQLLIALRSRLHVHSHAGEKPDSSRKPGPPPRRNLKRLKAPNSYFRPLDAHNLLVPPILPLWAGPVLRKLVGARRDATCAPWPEATSFRRLSTQCFLSLILTWICFASKDRSALRHGVSDFGI